MPALKEGSILLPADFANIHNPGYGTHAKMEGSGKSSVIRNWVDSRVTLDWMFDATPGKYKIEALINANENCKINVEVSNNKVLSEVQSTNNKFDVLSLGEIEISESGNQTITLSPDRDNWNPIDLMYVELVKI
jgi:alpha-L-fucosidase